MLAGLQPGGSDDVLGMQELLAAHGHPVEVPGRKGSAAQGAESGARPAQGHRCSSDAVSSAAFSPDGTRIVSGSTDKTVRLWDAATGKPIGQPMRGHDQLGDHGCVQPGRQPRRLGGPGRDGPVVGRGHREADRAADAGRRGPRSQRGVQPGWHPNRLRLASDAIQLWDAATGKQIGEPLSGHDRFALFWDVAFSPDGTRLLRQVTTRRSGYGTLATGSPIGQPLRGHDERVTSVAFSPDGTRIASASADKTVRLWDSRHRAPDRAAATPQQRGGKRRFSPDGARIVTGGDDKTIRSVGRGDGTRDRRSRWTPCGGRKCGVQPRWPAARVRRRRQHRPGMGRHQLAADCRPRRRRGRTPSSLTMAAASPRAARTKRCGGGTPPPGGRSAQPLRVGDVDAESVWPFGEDRVLSIGSDRTVLRMWDAHTGKAHR